MAKYVKGLNAGSSSLTATYSGKTASISITVNKAAGSLGGAIAIPEKSYSTSGYSIPLSVSGASGTVSFNTSSSYLTVYKGDSTISKTGWSVSSTGTLTVPVVDCGSYSVKCYITVAASDNYNSVSGYLTWYFTIKKITPTCSISISNYTYGGTKPNANFSSNMSVGSVNIYLNSSNSTSGGTLFGNATSTTFDVGTRYIYAVVGEGTNNLGTTVGPTAFTISKGSCPSYTAPTAKTGLTYSGSSQTLYNGGSSSYGSFSYSNGTRTNAGSQTVSWTFTPTNSNYNGASGSFDVSIGQATGSATVSGINVTYDRSSKTLISVSGATGTMYYRVGTSGSWTTTTPTSTNAGSWTIYYYMDASTNYTGRGSSSSPWGSVNSYINQKGVTVSWGTTSWTYDGSAHSTTCSISSGVISGDSCSVSLSGNSVGSNVGTATVTASLSNGNYYISSGGTSKTLSITQATGSATVSGVSLSYNGNSRSLVSVSGNTGTMHYRVGSSGSWTTTVPSSTNAGSWTIYYYMDSSTNYTGRGSSSSPWGSVSSSISKINPTYSAPTAKSGLTYNGSSQTLYNAGSNTTAGSFSYSGGSRTDAGSQTVSWTFTPTDTTNYNSASGSFTGSIGQASGSVTIKGVSLSYNGNSRSLATVSGATGTMHYSTNYSSWSTSIPSSTNCGSWTIYWYMDESTNYTGIGKSTSRYVSSSISKIDPSYTAPTAKSGLTYSGSSQTLYNAGSNTTAGSFSYSNGTRTAAGSQTVSWTFTPTDTTNYNTKSGSFTGSIGQATGTASVSGVSLSYNGNSRNLVTVSGNTGTMHYRVGTSGSWSTSIPTSTNAGSWTIYYYMDSSDNYTGRGSTSSPWGSVDSSIGKINPTYSAPTAKSGLTYNGSSQTLYNAGSNTTAGSFSYSGGSRTDAGSQTVSWSFTPTDTTNYNSASGSFTGSIGQATGSATVSGLTQTYNGTTDSNGTAQNLVSVSGATGTMHYRVGTSGSWTTTIPTRTNYGSDTIYYYMDSSTNYTGRGSSSSPWGSVTGTVNKRGQTAPVLNGAETTYPTQANASVKTAGTVAGGTAAAPGTLTWSNQSRSVAGSQTATAYYAATATNFSQSPTSAGVTVKVNQATGSATVSAVNVSYNGSSRNLITVSGNTGTMHYRVGTSGSWTETIPASTNAGSWTIYYYMDSSYNYTARGSSSSPWGSVSSSISKIDPTYTAPTAKTGLVYNGSSQTLYNAGSNTTAGSFSYTNGTKTTAGSQTVSWTFTPTDTTNYNTKSGSFTVSIAKATGYLTGTATNRTYNGSAQTIGSISTNSGTYYFGFGSSTTSGPSSWGSANTALSATTKGTYYVWAKCDESTNYNAVSAKYIGTATMGVRTVTVTAPTRTNRTYTGSAQTIFAAGSCTAGGTMYYSTSDTTFSTSTWSTDFPYTQQKTAGTYTIYYYCYVSDTTNNTGTGINTKGSISATISKASTNAPVLVAGGTTTYNGNTYYATAANGSGNPGGTIYYGASSGASTYSMTAGNATNMTSMGRKDVGTTTIYAFFQPTDTTNYSNSVVVSTTVTITNKESGSGSVTMSGWTYGGTVTNPTPSSSTNGTSNVSYTWYNSGKTTLSSKPGSTSTAGTYYVKATFAATTNYTEYTTDYVPFTISKAAGSGSVTMSGWTYGGTVTNPTPSSSTNGTSNVSYTWYNSSKTELSSKPGSNSTAGTYYVKATFAATTNYNAVTTDYVSFKISKATGTLSGSATDRTYNGSGQVVGTITSTTGTYYLGFGSSTSSGPSSWGSANSSLSATNAGTYYVWAKCDESTNYNGVGSKYIGTATISKKAVTVTAASDSKVYNGTALTNNTASISGQVSGHTLNSVTVTGSQTNVGSSSNVPSAAKIYSGSTDVTSNYSITYTNGTLTVSNATITVSAPNQSYTYTGSAQGNAITATTVNSQTATIKYGTTSGTYNLTSAPQITNVADSKTIYYKVTAPNHADKTGSYTLTITNKAISIPTPTSTSKTYDRTAYSATFGSATGATITKWRYLTDNSTWTETSSGNPTQTNYGTLYVQAYYSANTNYTGSGWSASATISISKREVTLTWGTHTWTYDGGAKTVTCTAGNVVSGDTCTVNLTGATRTSAGSQTVTASSLSNTNYKLPSTNTTTLTISKATLTVVESSYSGTYDGNNHSSTVKVTNSDWTGKTIVYGSSTSYGSTATTTGTYNTAYAVHTAKNYTSSITIYYKITGDDNYNDFADSVTFQISKATGSLTGSASNKTYNASSQVIGTISANTGTYYLGLGSSTTSGPSSWGSANSSLSVKDAGTYYVWAKCDGSTNYNAVSAKYIGTATVSQKSVTVTAGSAEKVYNGTALTSSNATATGLASENHHLHSWTCTGSQTYVGSSPNTASNAKIYEGTHNGTEVDVTSNYSISYSQGILSVTKATPVVTVTGVTEDYTGGSFYSTAKANAIGTFYWKKGSAPTTSSYDGSVELSTLNTATNAAFVKNNSDDFEMFWLFVPSGTATIASGQTYSANFSSTSSGSSGVNLIINPRDISKVSASAASVIYNGSQQTASVTVTDTATITSSDYTISGNTGTNAGNYSITITGKNNYTGTKTITWTINKKSVTVTAGSASKVYDGTPLTKTDGVTTTTLGTGDHLHSFKVTGSITNVGIENNVLSEIKIYKGAHNGTETDATSNYTITPENGTLIVNNATITVSAPNQEYTYNGSAQGAAISASAVGGQTATIKYGTTNGSYTLTSAPQITTVAESKTIYYQVTAPNHTTKTGSYLLTIKKFTVNATATNQSKTYNGTALNAENTGSIVETLPTGHTITYSCTGSQTNVGSSAKTLSSVTIKNGSGTDVTANFTVNKNNGTLTVNAATITVSAPKQSYTYDGNKHGNAITVTTVNSQEATIKYSTSSTGTFTTTVPQITNVAESKTIYYQVTAPNHTDKSGSYELEITEKSISIPTPTAKEETYTGTAYSVSFGSATGATITKYQYSSDNSTWTDSNTNPTRTDSGTTYVGAYYTAGTNYKGSGWSTSTTIKVNNATMTVSAPNQSYMYNGSAQGSAISATTVNSQVATITYGTTSGSYTLSSAPKITNVSESKTIYYKVTAPNHNNKTGSYTLTITQRAITFKANDQSKVYDGTALSAENTATRVTSTGNALVSGHTVVFTCSGTQTVVGSSDKTLSTVTIYDASTNNVSANYAITKNKGTLTVTARTVTFTEPTFNSDTLTYNKSSKTLASGATCSAGGVMYYYASTSSTPATFSTTTWSTDSASAVNAGTYNVWYYCYVVDTDNNTGTGINTANKMSGTKTIGQREVTLTWGTRTWTYDGSAHSTTCSAGNLVSGDTCTVTLTGNSITEIGSHTVTASSLSNPNYKLPSNNTATLTIEPGMFVKLSGSWTVVKKIYKKISGHWTEQSFDSLSTDDFYVKR